jgi:hypothetical protein
MFFWNVNARLDGDHHAGFQRAIGRARVVDIQADVMAQSMDEVAAERAALLVLAVRVDVVVSDPKQAVGAAARKAHPRLERRQRRILRAQDNFVDLALPRGELAVGRKRPGDVGGIAGVLPADVEHHEIAVFDLVAQAAVMQHRRVEARADNWCIGASLAAAVLVDVLHSRRDLVFVKSRAKHLHGFEMRVYGKLDGPREQLELARRLHLAHRADALGDIALRRLR